MVSIIIPIYNSQKYLRQCINSCLHQSYDDLEIILINDASKDDSLKICQTYCESDTRIRLIDNSINEGVEMSRYHGLQSAKGEYVMFIDSDDWLCDKKIVEKLVKYAEKENADYVEFGMQRVIDKWGLIKQKSNRHEEIIIQPDLFDKYYLSFFGKSLLPVNMCGKLYRKSTLDKVNLYPLELKMGEDEAFNLRLFPHLSKICMIPDTGYSYRWGGLTSKYNPYFYPHLKKLFLYREKLIKQYSYYKAGDPLRIEMKNVLMTQIAMLITYNIYPKPELIAWIDSELNDEMFQRICTLTQPETKHLMDEPEMVFIRTHNSEGLYLLGEKQYKSGKAMRLLKKAVFRLTNMF